MKKSLIIIFIVIVAIHVAALIFLIIQKESGDDSDKPPAFDSPPILVPEPKIDPKGTGVFKPPKSTLPESVNKKPIKIRKTEIIKSDPLNFRKAVVGNIKELPQSRSVNAGILVDSKTRQVLWSKNSKKAVPIASMTKMMTVLLVCEDIKNGKITPKTTIKVTKKAASIGGSDVWLDPRETFPLNELMKAVVIKSANDAAYLVAENIGGGDVEKFVQRMNSKAAEMGLNSIHFSNPHGLPNKKGKDNAASCEDMVFIAEKLLQYPEIIKLSSTKIAYLPRKIGKVKKTMLLNTNKLVRTKCKGVDGLKTGYTRNAGSCITVTCKRNGRRLIMVLAGCKGSKLRDSFAVKLLDWGYER